jgi:pimeloyl-ACP methyl ester carboxylesterase
MATARESMLAGAPVTARTLELSGTTTSVLESGEGAPVVLLHGAVECGGGLWTPVIPELAKNFRLIVPDFPGLGESTPLPRIDLDSLSDWIRGVFDQLGVVRPTLVAHSMLGGLAVRLARQDKSLLSRLVVYAAPAIGRYRMPVGLRYRGLRFALLPTLGNRERFQRFALLDKDSTRARDPVWFDAFSDYTLDRSRERHVKATMSKLISTQVKTVPGDELARIAAPTALLWGRADRMVPLRIAEPTAARLRWPLFVVESAGHVSAYRTTGCFRRDSHDDQPRFSALGRRGRVLDGRPIREDRCHGYGHP